MDLHPTADVEDVIEYTREGANIPTVCVFILEDLYNLSGK